MRIHIAGGCDAAKVLRKKLPVAGFVISEDLPDYTVYLEDSQDLENRDPVVHIDSIPCELETLVAFHISKLTKTDLRISRQTGKVYSEKEIRIIVPLRVEDSDAVETGVLRAFLDLVKPKEAPRSAPETIGSEAPLWKKMFGAKFSR